jgi:hypothetical protein
MVEIKSNNNWLRKTMNKPIVDFYSGKATDSSGRTLRKIHAWGYDKLENIHDYIQWLFPLSEPSQYNPLAPVLDAGQIAIFQTDAGLRAQLLASFDKMLGFYGFERNNMTVTRSNTWEERSPNWLNPGNHNLLRFTRILKSLTLLGLKDHADGLFVALNSVFAENPGAISGTTMGYWKRALLES